MSDQVTPAELRELAARARQIGKEIDDALMRLHEAPDEPTQRAGFRLPDAAGWARHAGDELEQTAGALARIRGRSECIVDWGVCPDHGATLRSSAGKSWCEHPDCGRRWGYDREGLPCTEPAAYEVTDSKDKAALMCTGHALAVRDNPGWRQTPLPAAGT